MKSRVIALIAVLALVLAACTGDVAETSTTAAPEEEPATTVAAEPTTTAAAEVTTTAAGYGKDLLAEYGEDPRRRIRRSSRRPSARWAVGSRTSSWPRSPGRIRTSTKPPSTRRWSVGATRMRHRHRRRAGHGLRRRRRRHGERLACGEPHGGHPPGAHLPGDRHHRLRRAANFNPDPAVHDQRHPVPDPERGVDFIVGYPDMGVALAGAIQGAEAAGIPYCPVLGGLCRSSRPGRRPRPRRGLLPVVGEDLCALGESFAGVLNDGVGSGEVGVLGGTPGNALSLGWQQCAIAALADGVELVNPPANENTTTGDTYWVERRSRSTSSAVCSRPTPTSRVGLRVRRRAVHRPPGVRRAGHPGEEPDASRCAPTSRPCSATGRSAPTHLPHLVLGRRQLPVTDRPSPRRC